jgi:hypothetical protein
MSLFCRHFWTVDKQEKLRETTSHLYYVEYWRCIKCGKHKMKQNKIKIRYDI